jgi:hypothetical protein
MNSVDLQKLIHRERERERTRGHKDRESALESVREREKERASERNFVFELRKWRWWALLRALLLLLLGLSYPRSRDCEAIKLPPNLIIMLQSLVTVAVAATRDCQWSQTRECRKGDKWY